MKLCSPFAVLLTVGVVTAQFCSIVQAQDEVAESQRNMGDKSEAADRQQIEQLEGRITDYDDSDELRLPILLIVVSPLIYVGFGFYIETGITGGLTLAVVQLIGAVVKSVLGVASCFLALALKDAMRKNRHIVCFMVMASVVFSSNHVARANEPKDDNKSSLEQRIAKIAAKEKAHRSRFLKAIQEGDKETALNEAEALQPLLAEIVALCKQQFPNDPRIRGWLDADATVTEFLADRYLLTDRLEDSIRARKRLIPVLEELNGKAHTKVRVHQSTLQLTQRMAEMPEERRKDAIACLHDWLTLPQAIPSSEDERRAHARQIEQIGLRCREYLGDHVLTANVFVKLALVRKLLGELDAAVEPATKGLQIRRKVLGDRDPQHSSSYAPSVVGGR